MRQRGRRAGLPSAVVQIKQRPALPRRRATALAAGMGQLNTNGCVGGLCPGARQVSAQRLRPGVIPNTQTAGANATICCDRGRLKKYHCRTPIQQAGPVGEVPVICQPVGASVLTHRRHNDAIFKGQATIGGRNVKGSKQRAHDDFLRANWLRGDCARGLNGNELCTMPLALGR